ALVASCTARIGHAALVLTPGLVWAHVKGSASERQDYEVRLWRVAGYARRTLALLAPKWFPQKRYFDELEFRRGRAIGQKTTQQRGQSAVACPSSGFAHQGIARGQGCDASTMNAGEG